jgi:hypothetical protein
MTSHNRSVMRRHWHSEELVRVVITIVISPASIYIVSPSTVIAITNPTFPTRHIATTVNFWWSTFYHLNATGNWFMTTSHLRLRSMYQRMLPSIYTMIYTIVTSRLSVSVHLFSRITILYFSIFSFATSSPLGTNS